MLRNTLLATIGAAALMAGAVVATPGHAEQPDQEEETVERFVVFETFGRET